MPKWNDYPLQECAEACDKIIKRGGTIYQKWTCDGCKNRITANNPNTFTIKCHCEDCGYITDVSVKGCNYLVHFVLKQPANLSSSSSSLREDDEDRRRKPDA